MLQTVPPITPGSTFPMNEDEARDQSHLLKAIADPVRIRMLSLLMRHEGNVCVQEMTKYFNLSQPDVSHHLRILREAGLVNYRKERLYVYYYVRKTALVSAWEIIEKLVNFA